MGFKLNLEFSGMCLYVHERTAEPQRFHVLLLAAPEEDPCDDEGEHVHRHYPRIFYDTAHDLDDPLRGLTRFNCISLADKVLDLSWIGGELEPLVEALPDVSHIAESGVLPSLLGSSPGSRVGARVTLGAGRGRPLIAEGPWEVDPAAGRVSIAHKIGWTLDVERDRLDWRLLGLNGLGGHPLSPLRPVRGEITLMVKNVMRDDLSTEDPKGPPPKRGHRMDHFSPYYDALVDPARRLLPVWRGDEGPGGPIGGNFRCGGARGTA